MIGFFIDYRAVELEAIKFKPHKNTPTPIYKLVCIENKRRFFVNKLDSFFQRC